MHTNPLLGTGYESFWLGSRLAKVSEAFEAGINEAHNGYLDLYLNLGFIGAGLLATFVISSYFKIYKCYKKDYLIGAMPLALWLVALFYNMTESAFKWHLLWTCFLLVIIAVPGIVDNPARAEAAVSLSKPRV